MGVPENAGEEQPVEEAEEPVAEEPKKKAKKAKKSRKVKKATKKTKKKKKSSKTKKTKKVKKTVKKKSCEKKKINIFYQKNMFLFQKVSNFYSVFCVHFDQTKKKTLFFLKTTCTFVLLSV